MGELAYQALRSTREAHPLEHLVDHATDPLGRMDAARRQPDIFAYAQAIEHARHLGLDANAETRDLVGVGAGNIVTAEQHLALTRLQLSGEHLEERAFPGAVRADQTTQLTFGQREVDVPYRLDATETHAETAGFQKWRCHHPSSACLGLSPAAMRRVRERSNNWPQSPSVGTNPFGTSSTNATRIIPRINGALANSFA